MHEKKNNVEEETKTAGRETGLDPCPVFHTGGEKAPSGQQPPKGPSPTSSSMEKYKYRINGKQHATKTTTSVNGKIQVMNQWKTTCGENNNKRQWKKTSKPSMENNMQRKQQQASMKKFASSINGKQHAYKTTKRVNEKWQVKHQ
jgi:hypothetical protein